MYPVPSEGEIRRYWATVTYVDKECENKIFREKEILFQRILSLLSSQGNLGKILDFGSNYGSFLIMAHKQGWECYGFEPFEPAAEELRKKGFDVRGGWSLETAGFSESYFDAITCLLYTSPSPRDS